MHADHLKDGPHRPARDNAGALGGRLHIDPGRAESGRERIMQGALGKRHGNHVAARLFHGLLNGERHFARLAAPHAHPAVAVANHGQRREAEHTTALDHLGDAVHFDQLFL